LENKFKDLKRQKIPIVLNKKKVEKILNSVYNIKHKIILILIYFSMLRVGEAVKLKLNDFDSRRTLIHIKEAKSSITKPDFSIAPIWKNN
jgi:integrase/recombinase XerD